MCSVGSLRSSCLPYPYSYQEILANWGEEWRENISCQVEWVSLLVRASGEWELQARLQRLTCILPKMHPGITGTSDPESALMLGTGGQSLTREKSHYPEQAWEVMRFPPPQPQPQLHSVPRIGGHLLRSSINSLHSANSDRPMSFVSSSISELA